MYSIAIDGPAGAGKSSIARRVAQQLGFLYVDTGAIYRTVGLFAAQNGIACRDAQGVTALLKNIKLRLDYAEDGSQHMFLCEEDVTEAIRQNKVSHYASQVSAIPEVRQFLLEMQRELARTHDVVMDGRDIATVVLPNADLKIFLTASPEIRATRRMKELNNPNLSYDTILSELKARDLADETRAIAPLRRAEDAVLLDTSSLDLEESIAAVKKLVEGTL